MSNYNEGRIVEKVNIIPTNSLKMAVQYINNGIIENQRQDIQNNAVQQINKKLIMQIYVDRRLQRGRL